MGRENSRWTYTSGSRPEGVVVYDDDTKLHSHHDTDPARGQNSAFDLVRLHLYGQLDKDTPGETPVTDRPSYRAMVEFANALPEIRAGRAAAEFEDLGDLPAVHTQPGVSTTSTGASGRDPAAALGELLNEQADQPARFTVYSASDFSAGAPLEWLVRRVLPRAEVVVIFGESGSGKTFLALDLCAAIALGIEWRANRTVRGGVVYVCAEGARGFKARLRAYAHANKVELAQLPAVIADAPNLLEPKDAAALARAIVAWVQKQGQVDVVVVDTLSATTPGGNENSGEDMGLVLSHCKFIHKHTGALVILIHHSGKDSTKGARGWSGLRAAADAEIEVVRNGDYRVANITKMKDGTDGASFAFKLKQVDLGFDSDGEAESSCVVEHVETEATAERTAKRTKLGVAEQTVFDVLKVMAPSGTMAVEDLVEGYKTRVAHVDGRDQRRQHAVRALNGLIAKRMAFKHGEDRVSLTSLITTGDDGWLG